MERAEIIREKGTNRSRFFRGQVDKYSWVDVGSSYLISDLLAAFLYAQLEERERVQTRRRQIWEQYNASLADWAQTNGVRMPIVPPECDQAYHMFYLLMPDLETRQAFIAHLKAHDVISVFHYLPLHRSEYAERWSHMGYDCPVTESVSDRLVRLPFYNSLSDQEQARVVETAQAFAAVHA